MTEDRIGALEALLTETKAAHGAYESTELKGVYDETWPRWYAEYAVDHGIGGLLGRDIAADELAAFLTNSWEEMERSDPKPTDPWETYTARRIASGLAGR
jgi:hypothetical protein